MSDERACHMRVAHGPHTWDTEDRQPLRYQCFGLDQNETLGDELFGWANAIADPGMDLNAAGNALADLARRVNAQVDDLSARLAEAEATVWGTAKAAADRIEYFRKRAEAVEAQRDDALRAASGYRQRAEKAEAERDEMAERYRAAEAECQRATAERFAWQCKFQDADDRRGESEAERDAALAKIDAALYRLGPGSKSLRSSTADEKAVREILRGHDDPTPCPEDVFGLACTQTTPGEVRLEARRVRHAGRPR